MNLRAVVGAEHYLEGEAAAPYAVEGVVPRAVVFPKDAEETARVVAAAAAHGWAVAPRGGGTQMNFGAPPRRLDLVVALERLDKVIAYEAADMTVTVEAGVPLRRLREHLASQGQTLPVDPPVGPAATIGGIVATRAFGPLRFGFRTVADRLLGVKVVTAEGKLVKAGGRVVKNVSGYEMGRLYAGSLGTLAILVEATFKVQPLPAVRRAAFVECPDLARGGEWVAALLASEVLPVLVELLGPGEAQGRVRGAAAMGGESPILLVAGFWGTDEEVEWQLEEAKRLTERSGAGQWLGASGDGDWEAVHAALVAAHAPVRPRTTEDAATTCRVHLSGSRLVPYLQRIAGETPGPAAKAGTRLAFAAHAGSGVAHLHIAGGPANEVASRIETLRREAESLEGFLIVEAAPRAVKEQVGVWGAPRADFFLHKAVKERMDPGGVLNPGRFLGGL